MFPIDNIAVRVNFDTVRVPINKIANIIEATSNNTPYPMEQDSIQAILYECLNEYMQFSLPNLPGKENCNFEHYLDDRFLAIAGILNPVITELNPNPDKRMMAFLNAQWAIACGELGRQLLPGIRDLNQHNQDVGALHMFRLDDHKTGMYVLTGVAYDEVDMAEEGL